MPWWPGLIIKPRLRLTRPGFGAPTRPPDILVFGLVLLVVLFVVGGNVYTLVKSPPAIAGSSSGAPILVYPALDAQLGMEGIVVSFVVLIGFLGFGILYYASKFVFQPGYATRLMALAVVLSGVAFLILTYLMDMKNS